MAQRPKFLYSMKKIIALFCLFVSFTALAQDLQFSQNYAVPALVNPAMTGIMNGNIRFNAAYRNQWNSLMPNTPFRSIFAAAEVAFSGFRAYDRLAAGVMVYNDKGGTVGINTNTFQVNLAYNAALSETMYVSIGMSGGILQKSLDLSAAQFGNQYEGAYNASLPTGEIWTNTNLSRPDLGAGVLAYWTPSLRKNLFMGMGMYHVLRPDFGFTGYTKDILKGKMSAQVGGSFPISEKIDIVPSFYFINQQQAYQLMGGGFMRYIFDYQRRTGLEKALSIGTWARMVGGTQASLAAIIPVIKLDYDNLAVGVSYDVATNQLRTATSGNGGLEISLSYIVKTPQQQKKVVDCPRF